ncbi:exopolyphosphatase [Endozoicomonas sp. OPT23]|uniref:exopolyphosphatase n=1 Tax=Endozoicomonas sp. OPT23 TaxID=2072845 RepID=UPI00129BD1EB|nr:exopolyphosphatase [Endozoicomonas sp. OPT23]MRI33269.1 exopolyphosphatase [Endozoicomonas sp. OPT23]
MTVQGRKEAAGQPLVAAIDLGSNSFHMIVARVEQGEIRPVERLGEKVQLAAGLSKNGLLSAQAMGRGLKCLAQFAQYISGRDFQAIRVVGTNALRKAKNSHEFVEKAEEILKHPIEIIAGREEARLIYLGVAQTQSDDQESRLVVDIGGGSTELIVGEKFEPKLLESLHMGCVTYTDKFFPSGELSPERFQSAYYAARLELLNIEQGYKELGWVDSVGSSGSIRAVSSILQAMGYDEVITLERMQMLKAKVLEHKSTNRIRFPGLKPDRQSIFPAGLAILMACFDAFGIKQMRYSDGALREGVLYDLLGRDRHEDVRGRTISALMQRNHVDKKNADGITRHALACFDQVHESWGLNSADRELLNWAAQVCEIGLDISHTHYNKHGAYLIQHSDLLGFSKEQQRQLSLLVQGHRRGFPKVLLEVDSHWKLLRLVILLRAAIVLNHINDQSTAYQLEVSDGEFCVSFPEGWLSEHALTAADFERERMYLNKAGFKLLVS